MTELLFLDGSLFIFLLYYFRRG